MKLLKAFMLFAAVALAALPSDAARRHRRAYHPTPVLSVQTAATNAVAAPVAASVAAKTNGPTITVSSSRVARDGEYTDKDHICWYLVEFGRLPRNFITKAEARRLGWQGGPLEPYAPGKSIGGDHFGNYERALPEGRYRECDVDTRGRPRGAKRIVYTESGVLKVYYSDDHYRTFTKIHEGGRK